MKEQLVKFLYQQNINIVLQNYAPEMHTEISNKYFEYLNCEYEDCESYGFNLERLMQVFNKKENLKWANMSVKEKNALLISDEFLDRIRFLSNQALLYATARLNNELQNLKIDNLFNKKEADEKIIQMQEYLLNVKEFNKEIALKMISEAILDYSYALYETNDMSFRISHLLK